MWHGIERGCVGQNRLANQLGNLCPGLREGGTYDGCGLGVSARDADRHS
jgi:hypothetical protein